MKTFIKQNIVSAILGALLAISGGYIYLQYQFINVISQRLVVVENQLGQVVSYLNQNMGQNSAVKPDEPTK